MTQVFISYKSEYRDFAIRLRDKLQSWGYDTWFDQDDIPPGEIFYIAIQEGLASSDTVLGVITPEALASRQVLAELHYAFEHGRLLPLLYRQAELIYFLSILSYIDFTADEDTGFERLQQILSSSHPLADMIPPPAGAGPSDSMSLADEDESFAEGVIPPSRKAVAPEPEPEEKLRAEQPPAAPPPAQPLPAANKRTLTGSAEHAEVVEPNREIMLQKVHDYWINGVLEPAVQMGRIDLDLSLQPKAVLRHAEYGDVPMPEDADAAEVYYGMQRELLILGAPGAGKTTLLLQLAQELIETARQDDSKPIPVIFNLASWAAKADPLSGWLVERLRLEYGVPKVTARQWLENETLSLLLDGLDEVAANERDACVAAINTYRTAHPLVDMVLCSRTDEYYELSERLDLRGAVLLQPLDESTIEAYVSVPELAGLRELIKTDPLVQDLAWIPFLLNALALAYRDEPYSALKGYNTFHARRDHLFERFVARRHRPNRAYTLEQTQHFLCCLARQLEKHEQIVFYLEDMQPSWLDRQWLYSPLVVAVVTMLGGIISALPLGITLALLSGLPFRLLPVLNFGLQAGLIFALIALAFMEIREIVARFGIYLGASAHGKSSVGSSLQRMLGALFTTFIPQRVTRIRIVDSVQHKWQWIGLTLGAIGGYIAGAVFYRIEVGLIFAGMFGLWFGYFQGFEPTTQVSRRTYPGEGLRLSFINTLRLGLLWTLALTIFFAGAGAVASISRRNAVSAMSRDQWIYFVVIGLSISLFNFIVGSTGMSNIIKYFILRLILWQQGSVPWNYARFLNYCTEIGLLRRVGGGYIFAHRYLLKYFASR